MDYDQLDLIEKRYEELGGMLSDPEIPSDTTRFTDLSKEEASIRKKVQVYQDYKKTLIDIKSTKEILRESFELEMMEMVKEEIIELKKKKKKLEEELKILLLPKDPNDNKNVIMEIRGAVGGNEATLFAADLFHMYQSYAELQGWKMEVMNATLTEIGGYKEIIIMISGQSVFSKLKYENSTHRVQRIPSTDSQGRIHTSTATVIVMPEIEEIEVNIEDKDIRTDIFHASGAGGQHVNKTSSAVRLTHLPTGIVVVMQDERSQLKNREKALKVLRARLYDSIQKKTQRKHDINRKLVVGTGNRSERIRTYNFPKNRVTDHRINLTIQKLDQVLSGKLDEIIDALILYDQTTRLEKISND